MRFVLYFVLVLSIGTARIYSQAAGLLQPSAAANATPPPETRVPDFWRAPAINALVILSSLANVRATGVCCVSRLVVRDDLPLLRRPEFQQVVGPYLWQPLTEQVMTNLQHDIIRYYRAHDHPLVDVVYPEQDVSNGNLQIVVREGWLSEVRVEDNKGNRYTNGWTREEKILTGISLKKLGRNSPTQLQENQLRESQGEKYYADLAQRFPLRESQLNSDLDWMNRNPFRQVNLLYEKGQEPGASDLVLKIEEQRPFQVFVGYEDTGSRATDEDRVLAGFSWGKAFGLTDHQLKYQFIANPGFDLVRGHSVSYVMPLPWRHLLRIFGSYVDVKGILDDGIELEGNGYQASLRYEIPLPFIGHYQHELALGGDYKYNENNLIFGVQSQHNFPTEVIQFALGYSGLVPDPWGQTGVGAQLYYSPGGLTDKNSDAAFGSYFNAKANYVFARFSAERATKLPVTPDWEIKNVNQCFSWNLRGLAQVSSANLTASEQLGFGGYAIARGYEEREANEDQGWLISNELRTPAFHPLRLFSKSLPEDGLQFLGFWDYGRGEPKNVASGQLSHVTFNSVGPGVRYRIGRYLEFRFDYGWQLKASGLDNDPTGHRRQRSRGHIGVQVNF